MVYHDDINGYATNPYGPWNVGSGSQELNGTYDMMGNAYEWRESPYYAGDYGATSVRCLRGGGWCYEVGDLDTSGRGTDYYPTLEADHSCGFRVASVPEPGSSPMLGDGDNRRRSASY